MANNENTKKKGLATAINCDRYQICSANVCPLDRDWQKRVHHNGERVCFYLIEAQKANAKAIFDTCGRGYLYQLMQEATQEIISRHYAINHVLEQAKKTGSRMSRKFGVSHE